MHRLRPLRSRLANGICRPGPHVSVVERCGTLTARIVFRECSCPMHLSSHITETVITIEGFRCLRSPLLHYGEIEVSESMHNSIQYYVFLIAFLLSQKKNHHQNLSLAYRGGRVRRMGRNRGHPGKLKIQAIRPNKYSFEFSTSTQPTGRDFFREKKGKPPRAKKKNPAQRLRPT